MLPLYGSETECIYDRRREEERKKLTILNAKVFISSINSGGQAEPEGSQYLLQDPISPTFPQLHTIRDLPIRIYAGEKDTTAPKDTLVRTKDELVRYGSKKVSLTMLPVDHGGLSTAPFNEELLNWMLQQKAHDSGWVPDQNLMPQCQPQTRRTMRSRRMVRS
jgi:hypothetical protein